MLLQLFTLQLRLVYCRAFYYVKLYRKFINNMQKVCIDKIS